MEAASYYQNGADNLVAYNGKIYSEQNIRRFIDDGHPIYIGRSRYIYDNELENYYVLSETGQQF